VIITQGWGAGLGIPITVATPPFPNVPALLGVPQLARSLLAPTSAPPTIGTQATSGALWQSTQAAPVWGVFTQATPDFGFGASPGVQAIIPDSVTDFGWRQEYRVSNYQIQQGQFASYNKVIVPFENSVTLTKGGSLSERTAFLQTVDAVVNDLSTMYTIRTPEKSYPNVVCTRAELSRRGAGNFAYFDVELFFVEVIDATAVYSSTSTNLSNSSVPSAIPTANNGQTAPSVPSSAVQSSALAAIAPPVPTG
jgi:hypothetical protein